MPTIPEPEKVDTGGSPCVCPFAAQVSNKISERAEKGLQKYGVTCERDDLTLTDWLTHLQEELMDAAVYIEKAKYEIWRDSATN